MEVSVVIPTFNRRDRIGDAICSVFEQANVDFEIIIVDDGSTDGTVDWLLSTFDDSRLRILRNTRGKGPSGARNEGILRANGDAVAFLDSDDRFLPGHLRSGLDVLNQIPQVSVVFGPALYERGGEQIEYMGPNFENKLSLAERSAEHLDCVVLAPSFFEHLLRFGCFFNLSSVMLRSVAARMLINESLRIAEDYEFWVRLSREYVFACLRKPQIRYVVHEENISFEQAGMESNNAPDVIKALDFIGQYHGLTNSQRKLLREQKSRIFFDWAYNCRKQRRYLEAFRLHGHGLINGFRKKHLVAMGKALAASLVRR